MWKKFKIIIALLLIIIISGIIVRNIGNKIEQQEKLYNRDELTKLENDLREAGVRLCFIQPKDQGRNNLVVMLSFWENDKEKIINNMDQIKKIIYDYTYKADKRINSPIYRFLDVSGFNLDDILEAENIVEKSSTYQEYHDIVERYKNDVYIRLNQAFSHEITDDNYAFKIIADINYDVTLDSYSPKQVFFFASFNQADTKQLQAIRISYKRLSGFDLERGDKIHFYNLKPHEFGLIHEMSKEMQRLINEDNFKDTIIFEPIMDLGKVAKIYKEYHQSSIPSPSPSDSPLIPTPSPTPAKIEEQLPWFRISVTASSPIPAVKPSASPKASHTPRIKPANIHKKNEPISLPWIRIPKGR